jgi:hypothetical protein
MKKTLRTVSSVSRSVALIALATGLVCAISEVRGELLFSDSFAYSAGSLDGDGPPPGSPPGQGSWVTLGGSPTVTIPGLRFPHILLAGGAVTLGDTGTTGDTASATITPTGVGSNGVAWIGYLLAQDNPRYPGYAIITFNDSFGPTAPQFGVIYGTNSYFGIDNGVIPMQRHLTHVQAGSTTVWVVVKLDFNAGLQSLFINPSRNGTPVSSQAKVHLPMTPDFRASGFDRIVLKSGYSASPNAYILDEVRVGTTFADLTP